jgi:hypothetical protein
MSRIDAAAWLSPRSVTAIAAKSRPKAPARTAQRAWTTAGEAARGAAFAARAIAGWTFDQAEACLTPSLTQLLLKPNR